MYAAASPPGRFGAASAGVATFSDFDERGGQTGPRAEPITYQAPTRSQVYPSYPPPPPPPSQQQQQLQQQHQHHQQPVLSYQPPRENGAFQFPSSSFISPPHTAITSDDRTPSLLDELSSTPVSSLPSNDSSRPELTYDALRSHQAASEAEQPLLPPPRTLAPQAIGLTPAATVHTPDTPPHETPVVTTSLLSPKDGMNDRMKYRRGAPTGEAEPNRPGTDDATVDCQSKDPTVRRRILRVSKKHASTWSGEIRDALVSVYGKPGRSNPFFWLKVLSSAVLLLTLLFWLVTRPTRTRVVDRLTLADTYLSPLEDSHGADHHHPELPPLTPSDVTIFTVFSPEPNASPEHTVHLRAMHSWVMRVAHPRQVHVYVREYSHCVSMQALGVTCRVSSCWDDEFGVPRLTCLIGEANRRADTELMMYVDDHIILFEDALPALFRVGRLEHFLMLGRSQPLTLKLDAKLDLTTWQHDLESAVFLDSSSEQSMDLLGQVGFEQRPLAKESKSLHFIAYARTDLDLSVLPDHLLMDGGSFTEHGWESAFLATMLVQDQVHVVDVSTAMTAIEFGHVDPSNHTNILNDHNWHLATDFTGISHLHPTVKQQAFIAHLALGRLENAHYVLTGRCPTCLLKENREADLPLILLRKANADRQIIVIATNAEYLSLTFNWICRAEALDIHNFVLLAEDRVSYRILRKMNVAVVLRKDAPYRKPAAPVGSKNFQETLYLRALFFHQIVTLGFSLIMTHLDTLWFFDPLAILAESDCDMFVQMEKHQRSSGGLLTIRNNPVGQAFAQDYLVCEQENWNFIQLHGKPRFSYSDDVDIDCIELISTRLVRRNNLKRCVLDPKRYVAERDFFDRQAPQRSAIWPNFVHLNLAQGLTNKTRAFTSWHLWGVDDDAMVHVPRIGDAHRHGELHCVKPPPALPRPSEEASSQLRILIHLLCSVEHRGIDLSLVALAAAKYDDRIPVDLTITLQPPSPENADRDAEAHRKTREIVQAFEWVHGAKTVVVLESFVGPTDLWIDEWGLHADNDAFLLVLQAGQILSPHWFIWTRQAIEHYHFDPFAYDPQLMAISLMHQLTIIGESPSDRYGSRLPSQVLRTADEEARASAAALNQTAHKVPASHLYLYQLVPLTGTVFFPRHFATFIQWYLMQNVSDARVPCVPTLISNTWWQTDHVRHWWVWLARFTFESGWYALYTNFHVATAINDPLLVASLHDGPRALLVDDEITTGAMVTTLLKEIQGLERHFPPREELRLYDLHFEEFTRPPSHLARRKFMLPPLPSSTSMTRAAELESVARARCDAIDAHDTDENKLRTLTGRLAVDRRLDTSTEEEHEHDSIESEEADISHLDVMIESMIQEMEERGVDSPAARSSDFAPNMEGKPRIADLRAAATARADRRRGGLHTHRAHHTRPIRGVELDRCYVVAQAQHAEETSECKDCFQLHPTLQQALRHRALEAKLSSETASSTDPAATPPPPPPPPAHLQSHDKISALVDPSQPIDLMDQYASIDAEELYNLMYEVAAPHLPAPGTSYDTKTGVRFMLYQPLKPAPFDRHLRGLYFSFLLAVLTNRILLVDLPDLNLMYECPFTNADWTWSNFKQQLADVPMAVFDSKKSAELRTASLDQVYHQVLLVHNDMVAQDRVIFKNTMYKSFSAALFGSSSRMRRTGYITRLLLSKPRAALTAAVAMTNREMGVTSEPKHTLAVHVVVPAEKMGKVPTAAEPLPGVPGKHWDCIRSFLLSMQLVSDDTVIVFSTNRPSQHALALARKEIGRFGRVVTNPLADNFNLSSGGVSSANTSSTLAVDANGEELIDPALVAGFMLGDADVSITSGTTHGIFYAARTNFQHRAFVVKLAPKKKKGATTPTEEDYCGPMHRLDLPLQEDITY